MEVLARLGKAVFSRSYAYLVIILVILGVTAGIELLMGRVPICTCGYIKLWSGNVISNENSQVISDWYTFSHIIHGFIFYLLLGKFAKRLPPKARLVIAVVIEAGWELLENNSILINRYRDTTTSVDYFGDSILNSLSDIVAMIFGYIVASKIPAKVTIFLAIIMEVIVGYIIRDNLTLNIIMLLYPIEAIKKWQMGL